MPGPPILQIGTTSQFKQIYSTYFATYLPAASPGYYNIGHYANQGGPPVGSVVTLAVENDDPKNPLLVQPADYTLVWQDPPSNVIFGDSAPSVVVGVWAPVAPNNYVALGMLATSAPYHSGAVPPKPALDAVRCLRYDYAVAEPVGAKIWVGEGANNNPLGVYITTGTNVMYAQDNTDPPAQPTYAPKNLQEYLSKLRES